MLKSSHGGRSFLALVMWCTASLVAAQQGDDEGTRGASAGETNWSLKGGDFSGQHYSPLAQVNAANVSRLGLAWAADLPIPDGVATTPIVMDGVVYLSGAYSIVLAVDAKNGDILWSYDPEVREAIAERAILSWLARAHRGVAVWDGTGVLDNRRLPVDCAGCSEGDTPLVPADLRQRPWLLHHGFALRGGR